MNSGATVTIFGAYDTPAGSEAFEQARAVGRALASLGYAVANGGYGGSMEASALGAKEGGGSTIGVTCSLWRSPANRHIDTVVHTANLNERLAKLIELGTGGFVVLPGATGTLLELALVWEQVAKAMIPPRPIVCWSSFWQPLVAMMRQARPACGQCITVTDDIAALMKAFSA